jgi:hypothetical protein
MKGVYHAASYVDRILWDSSDLAALQGNRRFC